MKKILCCLALLFALTGCKDAVSGVTNGDEALITVGKTEITKNDVYTGLKKVLKPVLKQKGYSVIDEDFYEEGKPRN